MSGSTGIARRIFAAAARVGFARRLLFRVYDRLVSRQRAWLPFERALGIDTRGFLPPHALKSGSPLDAQNTAYGGVMPSVMRHILDLLPNPEALHFIDVGAGKGRALALASERQFRSITGIELSPDLCAIARTNARIIARKHPARTPIAIVEGDASRPDLPGEGDVAAFFYHSFAPELVAVLAAHLAKAAGGRRIFLISLNPVNAAEVDAEPRFTRWHAEQMAYPPEELGITEDTSEALIIWQAGPDALPPHPGAERGIVITRPGWRCELTG